MATVASQLAVTSTAGNVLGILGDAGIYELTLKNSGANPIAIGPNGGVTAGNGYTMAANDVLRLRMSGDDTLFAISAAGSTLQVLCCGEVVGA